ncbi:pheA operon leader peptide PheL [Edaphovirga cremea]|nr:pheA operon leader peptide PheL [Edaphovirga cremea]
MIRTLFFFAFFFTFP